MAHKVKIGVIGCGARLRHVLSQIPGIQKDIEIAGVYDVRREACDMLCQQFGMQIPVFSDYHAMIAQKEIDWILIGSWNCFHREHAMSALEAGKHVFCEKPLATTAEDCLAIRDALRRTNRHFVVGFTLRYSPHYRKIKEVIDSGAIGSIVSMEFNGTLNFDHGGYIFGDWRRLMKNAGPYILEKCCHDIDLVNWIVKSRPSRVAGFGGLNFFIPENKILDSKLGPAPNGRPAYSSWAHPFDEENDPFESDKDIYDNQVAVLEFENGVRACFHTNCNTNLKERRMYICGTEGTLRADVMKGEIQFSKIGYNTEIVTLQTGTTDGHGNGDVVLGRCLSETMLAGKNPHTPLLDGLVSAMVCLAIEDACRTGRVVDMKSLWTLVDSK